MLAPSPAPDCTITLNPSFASFGTTSGTVATRFSPGNVSFGTPITWAMGGAPRTFDERDGGRQRSFPASSGFVVRGGTRQGTDSTSSRAPSWPEPPAPAVEPCQ